MQYCCRIVPVQVSTWGLLDDISVTCKQRKIDYGAKTNTTTQWGTNDIAISGLFLFLFVPSSLCRAPCQKDRRCHPAIAALPVEHQSWQLPLARPEQLSPPTARRTTSVTTGQETENDLFKMWRSLFSTSVMQIRLSRGIICNKCTLQR